MAASSVFGPSRARRIALDLRYALFALVYIAMLSWLSSHPEPKAPGSGALAQLAINLYHLPLYAGLGFFVLEAISRGQGMASFFFSSRRRHTRCSRDWSSDVCSSD